MDFLEKMKDGLAKVVPSKSSKPSGLSGGIGNGHGMMAVDDNMIVSKPTIVFHASQVFFNFLAMACFASVAAFQAKWGVGPSGLSGFALFVSIAGILLSLFMLLVPVIYEKYDKMTRLARALKEARVSFILTGTGNTFSLLIAFIVTISAWTEAGCKNADNDPNADKGDDFKDGLSGWCNTKKAAAIFFWLAFASWLASLILLILDWRSGKLHMGARDPPFQRPETANLDEDDDYDIGRNDRDEEETSYQQIPPVRTSMAAAPATRYDNSGSPTSPFADTHRYQPAANIGAPTAGRPSMDAYGAFSDPAPSGFAAPAPATRYSPAGGPPVLPEPDVGPRVSRTMQYADPYAAVRASLVGGQPATPPTYESYTGYR
ncbi:hypothetical protein BD626DRAFT_490413 [Schizophyllum amplum]|uniref:MARVEL domain-containing protein n=1 Tax=Schizophyllum amplum TaxID=97359 RepID=A0A550CJK3_9AGAR|nr:hypothetical protein BD626DRAFT_490413 [Auriculariopsis ampla]